MSKKQQQQWRQLSFKSESLSTSSIVIDDDDTRTRTGGSGPGGLAGNVAGMSATCCHDSQMLPLLVDIALLWRHKSDPNTHFCVGDCQHSPLSS
jgi:hypothetical protein